MGVKKCGESKGRYPVYPVALIANPESIHMYLYSILGRPFGYFILSSIRVKRNIF